LQLFAIFRIWDDSLLKVSSISPKPYWLQLLSMREDTPYQPDSQVTSYKHPLMIYLFVHRSRHWRGRTEKFSLLLHKLYLARQNPSVLKTTNLTSSWVLNSMKNRDKRTSTPSLRPSMFQCKDTSVLVSWISMNCFGQEFPLQGFISWSTEHTRSMNPSWSFGRRI